jgi:hypothetical protein
MAYNVWAMKWVSYRYGLHKSTDLPQGARAGGVSQSTHTHVGRSTQLDGRTSATSYVQDMRDWFAVGQMYRSVEDVATEPTARELVRRGLASPPQDLCELSHR